MRGLAQAAPIPLERIAALAAALPPRKESTPEEIESRRAVRRARIEAEKVAGIRNRRGELVRLTRAAIILRLTSRPGGATVQQIADACGWQRHTLRGYIGGTLRKRGHDIRIVRTKGEPARYVLEPTQ